MVSINKRFNALDTETAFLSEDRPKIKGLGVCESPAGSQDAGWMRRLWRLHRSDRRPEGDWSRSDRLCPPEEGR
jgi:hypothetical protein